METDAFLTGLKQCLHKAERAEPYATEIDNSEFAMLDLFGIIGKRIEIAREFGVEPRIWYPYHKFPIYPNLGPTVEKHRRQANSDKGDNKAYGRAVLAAINSLNRAAISRDVKIPPAECASRTWHSEGKDILKAVNAQNLAEHNRIAKKHFESVGGAEHYAKLYEKHMERQRAERATQSPMLLAA